MNSPPRHRGRVITLPQVEALRYAQIKVDEAIRMCRQSGAVRAARSLVSARKSVNGAVRHAEKQYRLLNPVQPDEITRVLPATQEP